MRKQSNTKQPRNRHPSPGEARPRLHSGARVHTEGRAVARDAPRRGYVTRKRTLKLQRKKTSIGTSSYSRRVASRRRGVCVGWLDGCADTHAQLDAAADVFVCLVDPTHGIFDGLRRVDSCTKRNVSRVVVHPSIVPSVGRVVERVCAEARERTARWSVRAYARVDGSIDIFSMHRVSSSAFACVGRVGRVGRMRGWLDGWEKPRALWTGAAARLCERGSIPCFFFGGS